MRFYNIAYGPKQIIVLYEQIVLVIDIIKLFTVLNYTQTHVFISYFEIII